MSNTIFTKSGMAFRAGKRKQGVGAWDAEAHRRHLAALSRRSTPAGFREPPAPRRAKDGADRKNERGDI